MSKKGIGLYPTNQDIQPRKEKVKIVEKKEEAFIYRDNIFGAQGLIPFSRFISKDDIDRVQIHSEVTIYKYYNASGKRLLAYHVRCE